MLIFSHRGNGFGHLENTLPALVAALEAGVDGVEFDVHLSRDGVPVIIHDETVDRTTSDTGYVHDKTAAELEALGAPRLETFLEEAKRFPKAIINIEIKALDMEREVVALLAGWPRERIIISSFEHKVLYTLQSLDETLRLGVLYEDHDEPVVEKVHEDTKAYSIHPATAQIDRLFSARQNVVCWIHKEAAFPNNMAEVRRAQAGGATILITDHARDVMQALKGV